MTERPPAATTGPPPSRGLFRSRLRDVRIRSKLGLILLIPLVAVVALAGVRLVDSGQRALSADQVRSLTAVSVEVSKVANQLHLERIEAAELLADPDGDFGPLDSAQRRTDQAIDDYQTARSELGDPPDIVRDRLVQVDTHLAELDQIRDEVFGDVPLSAGAVIVRYGVILADALTYQEAVGEVADDPDVAEEIRAVAAMAKAKTFAAEAEATTLIALADGQLTEEELTTFLATQTGQQEAFGTFAQNANLAQQAVANRALVGGNVVFADQALEAMLRSAGGDLELSPDVAATSFRGMATATRWAEEQLQAGLLASTTELRDAVFQQVLIETVVVLLALAIALTLAVLLARALARSLGQLRQHALSVADRELPATVARLSDPSTLGEHTPAQLAGQVNQPAQLRSRDEVGEVAQSFTVVHRAAVRIAAEQAALRTSVSAMFLNLARRSQALVDRMISQLDEIERNEEDPKRLSRMFVLDHLATRMRRNDENLLTLAGADSSPPRSDDAPVPDVLRAAQAEVEHYARIEFGTIDSDVAVAATAVNDVVRLSAELFDNATRFSPPDSPVVCEARRLGDQVIIQIEDRGVGMSPDQVQRLNAWLAAPPDLEVTTFRKMGLAVVARLANRHGIRIELRCDPSIGTIAYVALPRAILMLPASRLRYAEIPSPRSPMPPELPAAPQPAAPPAPPPSQPSPSAQPAAPAPPPAPPAAPSEAPAPSRTAEHQLPRRSPAVAHHAANRRGQDDRDATTNNSTAASGYAGGQPGHANNSVDMPVAGRSMYELTAQPTSAPPPAPPRPAQTPPAGSPTAPEATVELPIFKEMEAVWFRSHGDLDLGQQAPRAGGYPAAPNAGTPASAAPAPPPPPQQPPPQQPPARPAAPATAGTAAPGGSYSGYASRGYEASAPEQWQTAADSGWRAAAAAAEPQTGGATSSGLPKRVPQAQLVPGSVEAPTASSSSSSPNQRRSPEEVRGLLAAYHRGVQRGREGGGTQ